MLPAGNRDALHRLNGLLIEHFVEVMDDIVPGKEWEQWIVNTIVLHRTVGVVETATLETSATLWHNKKFFRQTDCGPESPVRSLDGRVPLDDSFAGLCVKTGHFIWIDDLEALQKGESPLKDVYRSFGYVGVKAAVLPAAEYVFPIRLRAGLTDIMWGVLNCEWYRPYGSSQSRFERHRDVVVHRVTDLLELHGRYLPVVLYEDGLEEVSFDDLSRCYDRMFKSHRREGVPS